MLDNLPIRSKIGGVMDDVVEPASCQNPIRVSHSETMVPQSERQAIMSASGEGQAMEEGK